MNPYLLAVVCGFAVFMAAVYEPPRRKPDWRPLSNADRFAIYEAKRFEKLGHRDLEANLVREMYGRKIKEEYMTYMKERALAQ